MALTRIPPADLRWRVDARQVAAEGPQSSPLAPTLDRLALALRRAQAAGSPGCAHVFVRGARGGPRAELLARALERIDPPARPAEDLCFVHNFDHPDRPLLIRMPAGSGHKLRSGLREISCFIRDRLEEALQARPIRNRLDALVDRCDSEMKRLTAPLERQLKPHGLVLVREQVGQLVRLGVHVQQTGRVITQDDLANLVAKGQVDTAEFEQIREVVRGVQPELRRIGAEINRTAAHSHQLRGRLLRAETRRLVASLAQPVLRRFDIPRIKQHLDAIVADVIEKRVDRPTQHLADPELLYGANLLPAAESDGVPVVREQIPSPRHLGGTIDPSWLDNKRSVASFQGIRGGSLMAAGNGFLVLDTDELIERPDSVRLLTTALVNGWLPIEPPAEQGASPAVTLRPDPVPIDARLVVLGSADEWRRLTRRHPDFAALFAAPVDMPDTIGRDAADVAWLAHRARGLARAESLDFSDEAVAALVEHAARQGGAGRLAVRTGDLRGLIRSAGLLARSERPDEDVHVSAVDVHAAIDAQRSEPTAGPAFPAGRPRAGRVVAAGLALDGPRGHGRLATVAASVVPASETRLAFEGLPEAVTAATPDRVTAALCELLHLQRAVALQGVIRYQPGGGGRPDLADPAHELSAVVAIVSRLADAPLRQDLAVAGRLGPDAGIAAVDGLDERIEDSYRCTQGAAPHGSAGIIVPGAQRDALMLRPWMVQAVRNDLFQVLAAGTVAKALELLTGADPGRWHDDGFPADSLLERARSRLLAAD